MDVKLAPKIGWPGEMIGTLAISKTAKPGTNLQNPGKTGKTREKCENRDQTGKDYQKPGKFRFSRYSGHPVDSFKLHVAESRKAKKYH